MVTSKSYTVFSSVQSLSRVRLFATLWIVTRQASLIYFSSKRNKNLSIIIIVKELLWTSGDLSSLLTPNLKSTMLHKKCAFLILIIVAWSITCSPSVISHWYLHAPPPPSAFTHIHCHCEPSISLRRTESVLWNLNEPVGSSHNVRLLQKHFLLCLLWDLYMS